MNEQEKAQLNELLEWKRSLENSSTIPLSVDQAFRTRFSLPQIEIKKIDIASTTAQSSNTSTVSMPGAKVGDAVFVVPYGSVLENVFGLAHVYAYVSSDGVVSMRFNNPDTVNTINPSSGLFTFILFKR